jgi:transcriptional regulator GlxA family with amidase domain
MVSELFRCAECNAEVQWLTPAIAGARVGVHASTVRRWVKQGSVHTWGLPSGRRLVCARSLNHSSKKEQTGRDDGLSRATVTDERLKRAVEYVRANLGEKLTVEQVTKVDGLSVSRFEELFKKEVGASLKHYQRTLRAREAERLLADPNLNLTQVAEKLGYPESSHFSRDFKKATSQTPREARKKLLSRQQ